MGNGRDSRPISSKWYVCIHLERITENHGGWGEGEDTQQILTNQPDNPRTEI